MKIFIAEYIIMFEAFDLPVYEELNVGLFVFDYINFYSSMSKLDDRFMYWFWYRNYPIGFNTNKFVRRREIATQFFWYRRFRKVWIWEFIVNLLLVPKKWTFLYHRFGINTRVCVFLNYNMLNNLVFRFHISPQEMSVYRIDFPKLDMALLHNHVNYQFPRGLLFFYKLYAEGGFKRIPFYNHRPTIFEFTLWALSWQPGHEVILYNPHCRYFTSHYGIWGGTYAKKWLYYTYHVFNVDRPRPFVVYGYWTENFFKTTFKYRTVSYRFELFRDYMMWFGLGGIFGTSEIVHKYFNFIFKLIFFSFIYYWGNLLFALIYSRKKLLSLLLLENHMPYWGYLYAVFINSIIVVETFVFLHKWRWARLIDKKVTRKIQVESRFFRFLKNSFMLPYFYVYKRNFITKPVYANWVDKCFLGSVNDFDPNNTLIFLILIFINIPFRIFSTFKTFFYRVHMLYYYKLNRRFKHSKLYNARSNYSFNRYFFHWIVYDRDLDWYNPFDIIERILNYIHIYSKREFIKLFDEHMETQYKLEALLRSKKRKNEYWNYFYWRTFGNYDPEVEFYTIKKHRMFTRWWYYGTDFSKDLLNTHQLYTFFNFIHSPLQVRYGSTSLFNFYYIYYYTKYYFYFCYYAYYYCFSMVKYLWNENKQYYIAYNTLFMSWWGYSLLHGFFQKILDGNSWVVLRYFWRDYIYLFCVWLRRNLFIINIIYLFYSFIKLIIYYIFILFYSYIIFFPPIIFKHLEKFFSYLSWYLFENSFGKDYSFWHKYYMFRFYFLEYNVFYAFFVFVKNFFFNFFLFILVIFVFTTIPYVKEFIYSDYVIYSLYRILNRIFEYNKFIYFNEVLDNWWVPYYSPKKFVNYYLGYTNYLEFRLKKMFGQFYVYNVRLSRMKFYYHKFYFRVYFRDYFLYLKNHKLTSFYNWARRVAPDSFAWELYLYMHSYFLLSNHPAKVFMGDIYFYTLPIKFSFILRYRYLYLYSNFFVPIYWFWKYSFTYLCFNVLMFFKNTIFINYILIFFKNWYHIYYSLNYYFFYFCYYYYFNFLFTVSKLMRYYFITYDFLNYIWIYRSARFIFIVDFVNFLKMCLDSIYFFSIEFCYGFFYSIYKVVYFFLNLFGLVSVYNYFTFSLTFIPKLNVLFSEVFDKLITLNYDFDEYGDLLRRHFRHATRYRIGDWSKRHPFARNHYRWMHRTVSFEYTVRQFLYYNNRGLITNFLVYNNIKVNTFNLFFFSCLNLYLNYILLFFTLSLVSLKLRASFRNDSLSVGSPFYEWWRFTPKNRHRMGRDEFYWLYNIRWLKRFEFYLDRCFTDDLFINTFARNEIEFGLFLYTKWHRYLIQNDDHLMKTLSTNRFVLYRRYYVERYMSLLKDIDFIFSTHSIRRKDIQSNVFSVFDFFVPYIKEDVDASISKRRRRRKKKKVEVNLNFKFDFTRDLKKSIGYMDTFWFFFGTPHILYNRNLNFYRGFANDESAKEFYRLLKKSLFKAYAWYEMNQKTINYDLFEFQFFEPEFYDELLFENYHVTDHAQRNYFLNRIAKSRFHTDLMYTNPSINLWEGYTYAGYDEFTNKAEDYIDYLRSVNSKYFDNFFEISINGFFYPHTTINTHLTPDIIIDSIDLSLSDKAIGLRYKELYEFEELGTVATEEHLFSIVEAAFYNSKVDPAVSVVAMTYDDSLALKFTGSWFVLMYIPIAILAVYFLEFTYIPRRYLFPHLSAREAWIWILSHLLRPEWAEILISHTYIEWERFILPFYPKNPWIWTKQNTMDYPYIELWSHWEGPKARFVRAKHGLLWYHILLDNDTGRFTNLSEIYWEFYIKTWNTDRFISAYFIIFEIIMFLIIHYVLRASINSTLIILDYYRYFPKRIYTYLGKDAGVENYKEYTKFEEEKKAEREEKKSLQFDFTKIDAFNRFNDDYRAAKRARQKKRYKL